MFPELAPISFLLAAFVLFPLPWHWRSGNVAVLALNAWLFALNIIYGIDAVIWSDNVNITTWYWCDITTKLIIGAQLAIPAACLCIAIHLEQVASVKFNHNAIAAKWRRLFETIMCFGVPLVFMGLHFVVQDRRFNIIEGIGCRPSTFFSAASIFILWIPPLFMSIASLAFSGLAIRRFFQRRSTFAIHLSDCNSGFSPSLYIRLLGMCITQILWTIATVAYSFWFTITSGPLRNWTNWADVHKEWMFVGQYPSTPTFARMYNGSYVLWWTIPVSTFIYISFFVCGRAAIDEYRQTFMAVKERFVTLTPLRWRSKSLPLFRKSPPKSLLTSLSVTITSTTEKFPPSPSPKALNFRPATSFRRSMRYLQRVSVPVSTLPPSPSVFPASPPHPLTQEIRISLPYSPPSPITPTPASHPYVRPRPEHMGSPLPVRPVSYLH